MNKLDYRSDIDGLRAIAVLGVVFHHVNFSWFSGGFIGVDVFFVISGYLITHYLLHQISQKGTLHFGHFYERRIRRLFPDLIIVILFIIFAWNLFLVGVTSDTDSLIRSIGYSLTGFGNLFFEQYAGGYFDIANEEQPLLHLWSLAVEEQFYLFWPLVIFACTYGTNENIHRSKKILNRLFYTTLLVSLLSFTWTYYLLETRTAAAFYWMPARAWELAAGALLVFIIPIFVRIIEKYPRWIKCVLLEIISLVGCLLILLGIFSYTSATKFPGFSALVPVLGTMFIILAGSSLHKTKVSLILSSRPLVWIGSISYGLYLWHWPLIAMLKVWSMGETIPLTLKWGVILFSIFMARVCLINIVNPIRSRRFFNSFTSKQIIIGCIACCSLVYILSLGTRFVEDRVVIEQNSLIRLLEQRASLRESCHGKFENIGSEICTKDFSGKKNSSEIIIWGNSHAPSIFPLFEKFAMDKKIMVTLYSSSVFPGFIFPKELIWRGDVKATKQANGFNSQIVSTISQKAKNKGNKTSVVLSSRWSCWLGKENTLRTKEICTFDSEKTREGTRRIIKDGLTRTLNTLKKNGVHRVLIVLPSPEFKYPTLRCLQRDSSLCMTQRKEMENYRLDIVNLILEVTAARNDVRTLDPVKYLCSESICPQVIETPKNQIPVVYDSHHLTNAASVYLGDKAQEELEWLLED